jgi:hypothetical protein
VYTIICPISIVRPHPRRYLLFQFMTLELSDVPFGGLASKLP